jgi:hypothetical protein
MELPMAADICADHALLLERLDHLTKSLDTNTETSNKLLERLEKVSTENSKAAVELEHVKADIARLDKADSDQWSAINGLRAKVYIGVGLALAGSSAITLLAGWIGGH